MPVKYNVSLQEMKIKVLGFWADTKNANCGESLSISPYLPILVIIYISK